jgi:hypothetical protein
MFPIREAYEGRAAVERLVTDRRPFDLVADGLTVALRAALSFDSRVELIWTTPLSGGGGLGSSQKGDLRGPDQGLSRPAQGS